MTATQPWFFFLAALTLVFRLHVQCVASNQIHVSVMVAWHKGSTTCSTATKTMQATHTMAP